MSTIEHQLRRMPQSVRAPIEQARARGWTAEHTAGRLGHDFELVLRVWEQQDILAMPGGVPVTA